MSDRLEKLKQLEDMLVVAMNACDLKSLAPIAKQYRDTIREIEEIEGGGNDGDEIGNLLEARETDGKSGAVRPSRT